jgi:septal ring factor EnvC (AmiA/AmiB activator)
MDISGVNLAAIQELNKEMKQRDAKVSAQLAKKDAEIASLKAQLSSMAATFSARMTALEQQQQRLGALTQMASLKETGSQGE